MRFLPILSCVLCLALAFGQGETTLPDSVVLRVDDRSLSLDAFDERFNVFIANLAAQQGIPLTSETRPLLAPLRPQFLEQITTEFVLLEEAGRRGLEPDQAYVDEQIATIRGSFESEAAFEQGLEQAGFASEALLRTLIGEAELIRRTLDALRGTIEVREYQLELFYDANAERYTQEPQVCARHILVATSEEAEALGAQLDAGADFATLAREHSTDTTSAERGGDLGCFPRGMMVAPFEQAAFETPVGQISDAVESRFGFHLINPYERKEATQVPLDEVRDEVQAEVENMVLREMVANLREGLDIDVNEALVAPEELPAPGAPEGGPQTE